VQMNKQNNEMDLGQAGGSCAKVKSTVLGNVAETIGNSLGRLDGLETRLDQLSVRLLGDAPPVEAKDTACVPDQGPGDVGVLWSACWELSRKLNKLTGHVDRLEGGL